MPSVGVRKITLTLFAFVAMGERGCSGLHRRRRLMCIQPAVASPGLLSRLGCPSRPP